MSTAPVSQAPPHREPAAAPRVREQARDVLVLMAFSAAVSIGFALCLLLLTSLGR